MSAIVALLDRGDGTVDPGLVADMADRLAHRGPDGGDTWVDGRVGLGHQLLATTPEAALANQPRRVDDVVVTADCRLDNRPELLEGLSLADADREISDAELLGRAYRRWDTACVEHLYGAFAFAIWDEATGALFCARDHFGVKPCYYHAGDDSFGVATELKALGSLPTVSGEIDDRTVGEFLTGTFEDKTNTFFTDVRRLPPAHAMTVDESGIETWRYWDLDPTRTLTLDSDAAYERRFRELFERAVSRRLRTDDPVGATLSGGLDSSSITVVAADLLPADEPVYTFSGVFDDAPSSDERDFLETLVHREGVESEYLFMDDVPLLVDEERLLATHEQPVHNTMHHLNWVAAKRAAESGVGVFLNGCHGDNAVDYGLGFLPELARKGRWLHLARELRAMGEILGVSPVTLARQRALAPLVPDAGERLYRRLRGRPVLEAQANPALDPGFVERTNLRSRYERLNRWGSPLRRCARRWQYNSLMFGQITAYLEANDLTCGAFGIEPRYPFTDVRLIEFTLAMPATQQLKDGWTRSIIRRALEDLLPRKIAWRPWKTMMNEAFQNALAAERNRLEALVADPGAVSRYVDDDALETCYEQYLDESGTRVSRALWWTLTLSIWLDEWASRTDGSSPLAGASVIPDPGRPARADPARRG